MNVNLAEAQLPVKDTFDMDIATQPLPRQMQQRSYYKSKGNRYGNSYSNNRRHNSYNNNNNNSRDFHETNQDKYNSAHSNHGRTNYKGNRTFPQNQQHSNSQYRHHECSQNCAHSHAYNSGRSNSSYQPSVHRKHSNDSGIVIPDSHFRQPGPYALQSDTYPQNPSLASTCLQSYETGNPQQQEYHMQGFHPANSTMPPSGIADDRFSHEASIPRQAVQSDRHGVQHFERPWTADTGAPAPSDTALSQPAYMVPWGYLPHVVHEIYQMMPPDSSSQQEVSEAQEAKETNGMTTTLSNAPEESTGSTEAQDVKDCHDHLREQLEWYFSPRNLATDTYLVSKMNAHRWVPISVVAEFKKVKAITEDIQEVVSALRRSPTVLVDDSGSMVKAVTVDRPRTTIILRELPEETTSEEITAIFADVCPAKSVKKEVVGNMWFIEFETAEDALAMLQYTRGKYLRGTPLAARLKSNTVLTGGEYKETRKTSFVAGNATNAESQSFNWSPPQLGPPDGLVASGIPIPYRRFPIEEGIEAQEPWNSPQGPVLLPQEMFHHPAINHSYPNEVFLPPNAYGTVPAVPANIFYMNGQMWVPAPAYAVPLQEAHFSQHHSSHEFPLFDQAGFDYVDGQRRYSNPEFRTHTRRNSADGFAGRKGGYNNRKSHGGSSRDGQHRQYGHQEHAEYWRQHERHVYQNLQQYGPHDDHEYHQQNFRQNGNHHSSRNGYVLYQGKEISGSRQPYRSNHYSDTRSDLSSASSPHSLNTGKKKRNKPKSKWSGNQQRGEHGLGEDPGLEGSQSMIDHPSALTAEEIGHKDMEDPDMKITEELTELVIGDLGSGPDMVEMGPEEAQRELEDHCNVGVEQAEDMLVTKISRQTVTRGNSKPWSGKRRSGSRHSDSSIPLGKASISWAPRLVNGSINSEGFDQSHESMPQLKADNQSFSVASEPNQSQGKSPRVRDAYISSNSGGIAKTSESQQRRVPISGMAMSAPEDTDSRIIAEDGRHSGASGEFSYASALKIQQQ
ncbi:hypothetical protein BGX27_004866 [Mortierella sp. AM989]|nr:hypothetical protein BGX27_004866 [Mortierella sp. AM989]